MPTYTPTATRTPTQTWTPSPSPTATVTPTSVPSGTVITKYYYFGSQRVAMKAGDTTYYFHADHLGSTSVTTNASGAVVNAQTYLAFGTVRTSEGGSAVTDFSFTGQRMDSASGLLYYGARYYDAYLNRWLSPDTIVSNPYNPQSLNRYSYVLNSPTNYVDPTGHMESCPDNACGDGGEDPAGPARTGIPCLDDPSPENCTVTPENADAAIAQGIEGGLPAEKDKKEKDDAAWQDYLRNRDLIEGCKSGSISSDACDKWFGGTTEARSVDCELWSCPVGSPIDYAFGILLLATPGGPEEEAVAVSEKAIIKYTDQSITHVVFNHFADSFVETAGRGKFLPHLDPLDLLQSAENVVPAVRWNGDLRRVVDAGIVIGEDRLKGTGWTSVYTVVTDANGILKTMFPGR